MPNSFPPSPTFYPAYCFPLSPTYNTWARLTSANVYGLTERAGFEGQNLYFHTNHPIKWVRLVGVIVAIDLYPKRWIMVLDDSSGATIEVTCALQLPAPAPPKQTDVGKADGVGISTKVAEEEVPLKGLTATGREIGLGRWDVGSVVKVKGGVGSFRGERQVLLERIAIVPTTNDEVAAWNETMAFFKDVLDRPWVVSEKDEKRAKRKAEGGEGKKKGMEEKTKRRKKDVDIGQEEEKRNRTREIEEREREREQREREREKRERERKEKEQEREREERERERRKREKAEREKREQEAMQMQMQMQMQKQKEKLEREAQMEREKTKEEQVGDGRENARKRREGERAERERIFLEMQKAKGVG